MLYVVIGFAVAGLLVLWAFHSPHVPADLIGNWKEWRKFWSVRLAVFSSFLESAQIFAERVHDALPQIESITGLHSVTSSDTYHTFVLCLTWFIVIARLWRQGAVVHSNSDQAR